MELKVILSGAAEKFDASIRARATAMLMEMEREFNNLKVEVSDAEAPAEGKRPKAGKDSQLARSPRQGATERPKRGKAASD